MEIFIIARIFDPYQALLLSPSLLELNLPKEKFSKIQDEWPIYKELCSDVVKHVAEADFILEKWWKAVKSRLPKMFA